MLPILDGRRIEREVEVINSEYLGKSNDRFSVTDEILRVAINPHLEDLSFAHGNKQSLLRSTQFATSTLKEMITKTIGRHYVGSRMSLVAIGRESLSKLAEMVVPLFVGIEKGEASSPADSLKRRLIGLSSKKGFEIKYVPANKDAKWLQINFFLPNFPWQPNPFAIEYLKKLFQDTGPGSLPFLLRDQNLTIDNDIMVEYSSLSTYLARFYLSFNLTEYGVTNAELILRELFAYLNYVKSQPLKPWMEEEINIERRTEFYTKNKLNVWELWQTLSDGMEWFGPKKALSGHYEQSTEKDRKQLNDALMLLKPNNIYYIVASQDFSGQTNHIGPWYKGQFSSREISSGLIDELQSINRSYDGLLKQNEFLPSVKLTLPRYNSTEPDDESYHRKLIYRDSKKRLWFGDLAYDRPKINVYLLFETPTLRSRVKFELFIQIAMRMLKERLGPAFRVGYSINMQASNRGGLSIDLEGLTNKMPKFFLTAIDIVINHRLDQKTFDSERILMIQRIREALSAQSIFRCWEIFATITTSSSVDTTDKLVEIDNISLADMESFRSRIFSSCFLESFIFGDVDKQTALELFKNAFDWLEENSTTRTDTDSQHDVGLLLPRTPNSYYLYEETSLTEPESAVIVDFQSKVEETKNQFVPYFLKYILLTKFFAQLRRLEGLGYFVECGSKMNNPVDNFFFVIQGNHNATFLRTRIEAFVSRIKSILIGMRPENLLIFKESYIRGTQMKPINFYDMMNEHWSREAGPIYTAERSVWDMMNITISDLLEYVERVFDPTSFRKLVIYVHGKSHPGRMDITLSNGTNVKNNVAQHYPEIIENIHEFKAKILYPSNVKTKMDSGELT